MWFRCLFTMFCRRLLKFGVQCLTNSFVKSTMMRDYPVCGRMTSVTNVACWKYFSLTKSKLMDPQSSPKIKKRPVFPNTTQRLFFKYLRDNDSFCTCQPLASEDNVHELLQKPIKELTDTELPDYIASVIKNGELTESLQAELDEECSSRLTRLETGVILKLVDAWLYVVPHILNKLQFFRKAMHKFDHVLKSASTSPSVFIQTYFYASLCKDKTLAGSVIRNALDRLQLSHSLMKTFNVEELAIICVSTFRTSNVITSRIFLREISDCIKSNIEKLLKDNSHFISLIKPLRPAQYYDLKLLDIIATNLALLESTNFVIKTHTFALFAESLYYDKNFLQKFADMIGRDLLLLLENKETMAIRMKDVSRFLWSLSYLGVVPAVDNLDQEIMEKISDWIDGNYFDVTNIHWLVSMMCSILIFKWDYDGLFQKVFSTFPTSKLQVPNHPRNQVNLNLLISSLQTEAPHLVSADLLNAVDSSRTPTPKKHLLTRPVLKNARNTVWLLSRRLDLTEIQCHFNIPHLYVLGISFYTPKRNLLNIEVLDSTNCLLTTNIPHGLMGLKLRLLNHLKQHIFIINSLELQKENNFYSIIENKIEEVDGDD